VELRWLAVKPTGQFEVKEWITKESRYNLKSYSKRNVYLPVLYFGLESNPNSASRELDQ
jgi:hypothetical protein